MNTVILSIFEKNPSGGEYIIADNSSVKFKEFVDFTADSIGQTHPGSIPMFIAKMVLGGDLIKLLTSWLTL